MLKIAASALLVVLLAIASHGAPVLLNGALTANSTNVAPAVDPIFINPVVIPADVDSAESADSADSAVSAVEVGDDNAKPEHNGHHHHGHKNHPEEEPEDQPPPRSLGNSIKAEFSKARDWFNHQTPVVRWLVVTGLIIAALIVIKISVISCIFIFVVCCRKKPSAAAPSASSAPVRSVMYKHAGKWDYTALPTDELLMRDDVLLVPMTDNAFKL